MPSPLSVSFMTELLSDLASYVQTHLSQRKIVSVDGATVIARPIGPGQDSLPIGKIRGVPVGPGGDGIFLRVNDRLICIGEIDKAQSPRGTLRVELNTVSVMEGVAGMDFGPGFVVTREDLAGVDQHDDEVNVAIDWEAGGSSTKIPRGDHAHGTDQIRMIGAVGRDASVNGSTTNISTFVPACVQSIFLTEGVWSANIMATATMFRNIASGSISMQLRVGGSSINDDIPVTVAAERRQIRLVLQRSGDIVVPAGGTTLEVGLDIRGLTTAGTTYVEADTLFGMVWKAG
jgi:hypothetical protein